MTPTGEPELEPEVFTAPGFVTIITITMLSIVPAEENIGHIVICDNETNVDAISCNSQSLSHHVPALKY